MGEWATIGREWKTIGRGGGIWPEYIIQTINFRCGYCIPQLLPFVKGSSRHLIEWLSHLSYPLVCNAFGTVNFELLGHVFVCVHMY